MNRQEHLEWCKERAYEYLDDGDVGNALASIMSDIGKHPETQNHAGIELTGMLMFGGHLQTTEQVRKHIEGFN